jgi:hypothetical protein
MSKIARFKTRNETVVQVEVEDSSTTSLVSLGDDMVEAGEYFEDAIAGIKPIADYVVETIADLATKPKETSVTFGVKFSGEAGMIVAKSTLEASLQVTLKW